MHHMSKIVSRFTLPAATKFILSLFLAVGILALLVWSAATLGRCRERLESMVVQGSALHGIMYGGQTVFADYNHYRCHTIERGHIVLYESIGHDTLLPIIVKGIPGDTWELRPTDGGHHIVVSGETLRNSFDEPYLLNESKARLLDLYVRDYKGVIPAGAFLLLGNLPQGAMDSTQFGLVSDRQIKARVVLLKEEL